MSKLLDKHIELVEAVNNSTGAAKDTARNILDGFRMGLDMQGINQLMDCDLHYIEQGIDRPMCCGVFLD